MGQLFGFKNRAFFPLSVSRNNKTITAPFLFDTGSKHTFLRKDTPKALDVKGEIPGGVDVTLHGFKHHRIWESHSHFTNVDVIGQDFLEKFRLTIQISPARFKAVLMRDEENF